MYSNTISIVHSNFRKKEPQYYLFRPYFCNELVNRGHQSGAGQGRKPRPGLGFLPWPVTQKYYLSKPPLVTSSPTPPQASVGAAQSTAESPRLLLATEWAESLWLLLVSPLAGVWYLLMIEIRAGFNDIFYVFCIAHTI